MGKQLPKTTTAATVLAACEDKSTKCKLALFSFVVNDTEPFVKNFQTAAPMAPFLYEDLTMMLRTIMTRFIKEEVLEAEKFSSQLVKIDVKQKNVHRSYKEVDIGVAAKWAITVSKMSDREILQFRMQCIDFLVAMSSKLMEKSPLRYTLTRAISCLVPQTLQNCRSLSEARMDKLTEILYETQKFFMRHKT